MITGFILFLLFLCWGSFLNFLAHRLIHDVSLFSLPHCIRCKQAVPWRDTIPLFSYVFLHKKCRSCDAPFSWIYPFTELLTAGLLTTLYYTHDYFIGYAVFFSALIITIHTDLETMLISRWVTLALVPVGIIFSFVDLIPIIPLDSILGLCFGYGFLWTIASLFAWWTHKEGMGEGDFDLMALIGSFTGIVGSWSALLLGSLLGSVCGILMILIKKNHIDRSSHIPFGPFLAAGALIQIFLQT